MVDALSEWRIIPGFERYEVSDDGRVRYALTGKERALHANTHGYIHVSMHAGPLTERVIGVRNRPLTRKVHRLVALAFLPNPDGKPEVNHKNCDRRDNRVENLEWATRAENITHSILAGRNTAIGNPNKIRKLTPEAVAIIRKEYVYGLGGNAVQRRGNSKELAERFGVMRSTILRVVNRKSKIYEP